MFGDRGHTADTRTKDAAVLGLLGWVLRRVKLRVLKRLVGSDQRELTVAIHFVGFFLANDVSTVPVPNIRAHFDFDIGAVEELDLVNAALASQNSLPAIFDFATK